MKKIRLVLMSALMCSLAGSAPALAAPKCNQAKNKALATKTITTAIADSKHPLRIAYEAFLAKNDDGVSNRYSELPSGQDRMAWYREPVKNKWVQIIPMGTSRGTEGESKQDSTTTCVDEYLAIVAVPVEYKWDGKHLLFMANVRVTNGAKGASAQLTTLSVSEDPEPAAVTPAAAQPSTNKPALAPVAKPVPVPAKASGK